MTPQLLLSLNALCVQGKCANQWPVLQAYCLEICKTFKYKNSNLHTVIMTNLEIQKLDYPRKTGNVR
jgi:hypothetical protein